MDTERLSNFTISQITHARSLDFVRWASALHVSGSSSIASAAEVFEAKHPRSLSIDLVRKAAVAAGTSTDATWAGPLAALKPLSDGFLSFLRPATLLGRIPNLRRVPFNISVSKQTTGGTYQWIGQGAPAPVSKIDLATVTLGIAKAGGIIVVSEELAKLSRPGAEVVLRDEMVKGVAKFLNAQFVDPAVAAVANVNPASITNGTTAIVSSGTLAANAATDMQALLSQFLAAHPSVEAMVLLMSPANAVAVSRALNQPTLGLNGGTLYGIPVVTSNSVGTSIIALDAQEILYADDDGLEVDKSSAATLQMDSAPDDPTSASTVMISLYQRNLAGFRVTRYVNWKRAATDSVKYVSGAVYA
ncbi:MAG TPA: phage major capsid protein [Vicinamibacterales bacterium]|nr:phage major capsid protein [Vicinamibacterales bacterium]